MRKILVFGVLLGGLVIAMSSQSCKGESEPINSMCKDFCNELVNAMDDSDWYDLGFEGVNGTIVGHVEDVDIPQTLVLLVVPRLLARLERLVDLPHVGLVAFDLVSRVSRLSTLGEAEDVAHERGDQAEGYTCEPVRLGDVVRRFQHGERGDRDETL